MIEWEDAYCTAARQARGVRASRTVLLFDRFPTPVAAVLPRRSRPFSHACRGRFPAPVATVSPRLPDQRRVRWSGAAALSMIRLRSIAIDDDVERWHNARGVADRAYIDR